MQFHDRVDAGQQLARKLKKYKEEDIVVFALPRGGVVTAFVIAKYIQAPLDLIIVRKVGHPHSPEYALCAVAEDGHRVCNEEDLFLVDKEWFEMEVEKEIWEAKRRRKVYLGERKTINIEGKTAILVDDGVATGLTLRAAILELKDRRPQKIIVAVPVISKEISDRIKREVDEVIALVVAEEYRGSVGAYYDFFPQVSDEEVIQIISSQ